LGPIKKGPKTRVLLGVSKTTIFETFDFFLIIELFFCRLYDKLFILDRILVCFGTYQKKDQNQGIIGTFETFRVIYNFFVILFKLFITLLCVFNAYVKSG
jgi:hypothetical protein